MAGIDIQIIEYHNGKPMHFYDGLQECATAFHCHTELIKGLIFTGQAFPYLEESITFDIHPSCNCRIVRRKKTDGHQNNQNHNQNHNNSDNDGNGSGSTSARKTTRYYTFDIIGNDDEGDGKEVEKGGETIERRDE